MCKAGKRTISKTSSKHGYVFSFSANDCRKCPLAAGFCERLSGEGKSSSIRTPASKNPGVSSGLGCDITYETIAQIGKNLYWAYDNDASDFTETGRQLFINTVQYMTQYGND